jgi:peptide/nickel transport system substrate-binding protein
MRKKLWFFIGVLVSVLFISVGTIWADKTVTIVLSEEPENLDPCNTPRAAVGRVVLKNVVETLVEIDPDDSSMKPRLATAWKQIDPSTWQFTLRKGVKFHDGEDFNAKAAVYGIERATDKSIKSSIYGKFFSHLTMTLRAVDSHTLEIKTDKAEPIMPMLMGLMTFPSPKTPMGKFIRVPVGTGPYKFVKWDAGTQIVLERFPGYWGKQPEVEKAVYIFRSESALRASMVKIGEADIAPDIAVQDATDPGMDFSYFNSETSFLRLDAFRPPLNDKRVRMALNLAVDRNSLRGSIFSKAVVPAAQLVVPRITGHNPNLKPWPYDPQKAKELLAEAKRDGVPVDTELLMVGRPGIYPNAPELMEALMSMFRAVGFNVKLKNVEVGIYFEYLYKPFPQGPPVLLQGQHDNNAGDAVFSVPNKYRCEARQSAFCDKKLDAIIDNARVATGEERRKLWQETFKYLHDEAIEVFLFHMVGFSRVGKRLNYKPTIAINSELQLDQISFK